MVRHFAKTVTLRQEETRLRFAFATVREVLVDTVSNCLQNQLRFDFATTNYATDAMILADGGASLAAYQHVIWDTNEALRKNIGELVKIFDRCSSFSGIIQRIAEVDERISQEELKLGSGSTGAEREVLSVSTLQPSTSLQLKDVCWFVNSWVSQSTKSYRILPPG